MSKNYRIILRSLLIILIMSSCVTQKKLTYLKYSKEVDQSVSSESYIQNHVTPSSYKIQPFDNLFIRVLTPDPQWSSLFNIMPVGAGGAVTQESAALFGYPVDIDGKIEIPFVGKIKAAGKTLYEFKIELDSTFKNYVNDAAISVRLVNNYVSLLGEVNQPGRYPLTKDQINIFEALSMASDMREFSNRQRVQLIRPTPYGPVIKELSLSDRSILSSEFYYVMPNDVIYVMPIHGRSFQINSSVWTFFLGTITSALGVLAFFRTF